MANWPLLRADQELADRWAPARKHVHVSPYFFVTLNARHSRHRHLESHVPRSADDNMEQDLTGRWLSDNLYSLFNLYSLLSQSRRQCGICTLVSEKVPEFVTSPKTGSGMYIELLSQYKGKRQQWIDISKTEGNRTGG